MIDMTPQEKANELVEKFKEHSQLMIGYGGFSSRNGSAKQCALIAVDEILTLKAESFDELPNPHHYFSINYWKEVKQEINKL